MSNQNQPTLPQNNNPQQMSQNTFAHFKILSELGRGGMGCVYKAFDTKLQRVVALKVLIAQDQAGAKQIQRFLIEAQATAKLMHPNIVRVYEIGQHNKTTFFTMDYINGVSLKELIKTKKLTLRSGIKLIKKVAQGMHHAHQKGIIHRDLKPANIMVDSANEPYVMDFGLAKVMDSDKNLTQTGTIMGTLFYMPPEQAEGQHRQIDQRSDIYSLGAILYEIVTGRVPHHANSTLSLLKKITLEPVEPPSKVKKDLPKNLDHICLKALAKKKEDRYQDADELAQNLENFNADKPIKATKGKKSWHKISIGIVSLLLLLSLIWAMSSFKTKPKEVSPKAPSLSINRSIKQHIALVIGNAKYTKIPLQNAVNDAVAIANVLKKLGFEVVLLTNASQRKMGDEIRNFGDKLKQKKAAALFYYAGHGVQVKGRNYLIPVDSNIKREDEVSFNAIDAGLVLAKMESANTAINLMFLDACRDNPFVTDSRSTSRGLARMDAPHGSLISYATAPGKTASDGDGEHGVFTKHLLRFIQEPGLEVGKIMRKVRQAVRLETGGEQVPWDSSSLEGDFYFLLPKNKTVVEIASKKESKQSKQASKQTKKIPTGLTAFEYIGENTYTVGGQENKIKEYLHKQTGIEFALVPEGTFDMGNTKGEFREKPVHKVKLDSFLMSKTEITQGVWEKVMKTTPWSGRKYVQNNPRHPAVYVSWDDCYIFYQRTGLKLPTEAQWEYAARAGTKTKFYWGDTIHDDYLWHRDNAYDLGKRYGLPVATRKPNAFGLHDILGNVIELCYDWMGSYSSGYQINPKGPATGVERIRRGGHWNCYPQQLRPTLRIPYSPALRDTAVGFRVVASTSQNNVPQMPKKTPQMEIEGFIYLQEATYSAGEQVQTVHEYHHKKTEMEFVLIPGGTFMMGNNKGKADERPAHQVQLDAFLMSKTVVTQKVWQKIMKTTPWNVSSTVVKEANCPAVFISWEDSKLFCQRTGLKMPTEAQWEYAARAGTNSKYYWGDQPNGDYLWYRENAYDKGHRFGHGVAQKSPNAFGLYDMLGNVWQWCYDWKGYYSSKGQVNPKGPTEGIGRVRRGGHWAFSGKQISSTMRESYSLDVPSPEIGLRVVFGIPPKKNK